MKSVNPLIVALDVETLDEAKHLVDVLSPVVDVFKIGSQLFTAYGPDAVRYVLKKGKRVFLDLKFHDIPNTVANAVSSATSLVEGNHGLLMMTIHTQGGNEMCAAAAKAALDKSKKLGIAKPYILGITVLTSDAAQDNMTEIVLQRAQMAFDAGLDGVVSSVQEVGALRRQFGKDFILVTPGIRPSGAQTGDQKRVDTPASAIEQGSSFLVVGRPIVKAENPFEAARQILQDINRARK